MSMLPLLQWDCTWAAKVYINKWRPQVIISKHVVLHVIDIAALGFMNIFSLVSKFWFSNMRKSIFASKIQIKYKMSLVYINGKRWLHKTVLTIWFEKNKISYKNFLIDWHRFKPRKRNIFFENKIFVQGWSSKMVKNAKTKIKHLRNV